jgi:hypothetical protein
MLMSVMFSVVAVFVVLALLGGGIYLIKRWADRKAQAIDDDLLASHNRTVEFFVREHEREVTRINELVKLPWSELRAWCERINGQPCECPTKGKIAQRIYWHERRQEDENRHPVEV